MVRRMWRVEGQPEEKRFAALGFDPGDGVVCRFGGGVGADVAGYPVFYLGPVAETADRTQKITFKMIITHAVGENPIGGRHGRMQVPFADIGLGDAIGRVAVEQLWNGDFGRIQHRLRTNVELNRQRRFWLRWQCGRFGQTAIYFGCLDPKLLQIQSRIFFVEGILHVRGCRAYWH